MDLLVQDKQKAKLQYQMKVIIAESHMNRLPSQIQNRRQYTIDGNDINIYVNSDNQVVIDIRVKIIENYSSEMELKFENQQKIGNIERAYKELFISKIKKEENIQVQHQKNKQIASNNPIFLSTDKVNYNNFPGLNPTEDVKNQSNAINTSPNVANGFQQKYNQNSNQNLPFKGQINQNPNNNLNYNLVSNLSRPDWAVSGNVERSNYGNSTQSNQPSFSLNNVFLGQSNQSSSLFAQNNDNANATRRTKQSRRNRKQTVYK